MRGPAFAPPNESASCAVKCSSPVLITCRPKVTPLSAAAEAEAVTVAGEIAVLASR